MPHGSRSRATSCAVFLLLVAAVVHVADATTASAQKAKSNPPAASKNVPAAPEIRNSLDGLPQPVLEMREAILAAAKSGKIEELLVPIEMNELKPDLGNGPAPDPISHLKAQSTGGDGKDILAALEKVLEAPYAIVPLGRDLENNRIYMWPSFAETGVSNLTAEQQAELRALAPEAVVTEMLAKGGGYTWWRVGIAADGTWHVFAK